MSASLSARPSEAAAFALQFPTAFRILISHLKEIKKRRCHPLKSTGEIRSRHLTLFDIDDANCAVTMCLGDDRKRRYYFVILRVLNMIETRGLLNVGR